MSEVIEIDTGAAEVVEIVEKGPKGDPGAGLPPGGTTGQALLKASNADGDTEWGDVGGGGGGQSGPTSWSDFDDFIAINLNTNKIFTNTSTGTGSASTTQTPTAGSFQNKPGWNGVWRLETGTITTGGASVNTPATVFFKPFDLVGLTIGFVSTKAYIEQMPTVDEDFYFFSGWSRSSLGAMTAANVPVGFLADRAYENWQFVYYEPGDVFTAIDTGIAVEAQVEHIFRTELYADETGEDWGDLGMRGYIDGVLVAEATGIRSPGANARIYPLAAVIRKTAGTTEVFAYLDWVHAGMEYENER